jgi:hypothetical protein
MFACTLCLLNVNVTNCKYYFRHIRSMHKSCLASDYIDTLIPWLVHRLKLLKYPVKRWLTLTSNIVFTIVVSGCSNANRYLRVRFSTIYFFRALVPSVTSNILNLLRTHMYTCVHNQCYSNAILYIRPLYLRSGTQRDQAARSRSCVEIIPPYLQVFPLKGFHAKKTLHIKRPAVPVHEYIIATPCYIHP